MDSKDMQAIIKHLEADPVVEVGRVAALCDLPAGASCMHGLMMRCPA